MIWQKNLKSIPLVKIVFMKSIITKEILEKTIRLRHSLHRYPELSGHEHDTAARIKSFLTEQKPDQVIEGLGGYGIAAVFDSGKEGPVVLLRCDLDGLPIEEVNTFPYRSQHQGVSHKCGHDGHMAILAGLSMILRDHKPGRGRLVLLFQPEEETGQGAAKVINDTKFRQIRPDYAFALHNLPGFSKNTVIMKEGPFAAASRGLIAQLQGRSSHAAHPEQGASPVHMMCELINELMKVPQNTGLFRDFALLTIIHARLGEVAFGTNPGKALVMATLRTFLNDDMKILDEQARAVALSLAKKHGIEINTSYAEEFPATVNHPRASGIVKNAIERSHAASLMINEPFRWSEDFGHFTGLTQGALFGLGAGEKHPSLHNHDYDFPDEIIETGIAMFYHIADQLLNLHKNV